MKRRGLNQLVLEFMILFVIVGSLTLLGCGGGDDDNSATSGQPAPSPSPSPPPASFASDIQPIFTQNCAKVGCHAGAAPPPSAKPLNLEAGQAYGNIVAVFSGQRPALMRVQPGDANNSYLFQKHTGAAGIGGSRMPLDNPTFFDVNPALLELERRWIAEGALNN